MRNKKRNNWIYVLVFMILLVLIPVYLFFNHMPTETNWIEVKSKMLANNDIEHIVVVNNKRANVYLKEDAINKYKNESGSFFFGPLESGPHFSFNVGSVETFERNLREAQSNNEYKVIPEYKEEKNWITEITWTSLPFLLIIFLIALYFLPTFISKNKNHFYSIVIVNVLLGWTVVGWIASLIWAINSPVQSKTFTYICAKCNYNYQINQKVKLFVCPNCNYENDLNQ